MKIKSMTACFGRLDHARLDLSDGLNILHAPNEGGKSTWCAFIRAMLYGVPTRDRDKKGYLAEKNRYQPWSGAPMEGEMTLEWRGRGITLRRFTKGATPFGGFSAVYTDTQQPVPELTAQNCGEVLLGVGREVWERSAFIGCAPTLAIDGTPELERRIAALFSSGEEDVSFSQTEAKLREWQRRRQHNRSGLIPKLEEEISSLDRTLEQMRTACTRLSQVGDQRSKLQTQLQDLEGEAHIHQRLAQRDLNARYAQALEQQRQARAQLDDLLAQQSKFGPLPHRDRLRDAQLQLQRLELQEEELHRQEHVEPTVPLTSPTDPRFSGLDGTEAIRRAQDERTQVEALLTQAQEKARNRRRCVLPGLLLSACAILVGLAANQLIFGLLAGSFLAVVLALICLSRTKAQATRLQKQAQEILARWNVTQPHEITDAAELYRQQAEALERTREEHVRIRAQLEARRNGLVGACADLLAFVHSFAPEVHALSGCTSALTTALELDDQIRTCRDRLELISRRCDDLKSQGAQETDTLELLHAPGRTPDQTQQALSQVKAMLAELDRQEALAKGELLTLGDRTQLETRREQLTAQLERRRTEYNALSLALDGLRQANASLQERFAPELNHRSGQVLSALTGGRYDSLTLNREFEAAARSTDSLLPHSTLALSRGTGDQIYLAVRLAVCQLCLNEEESSPLVLDDALLTFDDSRMAQAVDYLSKTGQQVLLFSCQQRECSLGLGRAQVLQS